MKAAYPGHRAVNLGYGAHSRSLIPLDTLCARCGEIYGLHGFSTNECPQSLADSFNYSEAITKASQTADLFIRDLQEAHVKSPNVATEILLLDYIARTRAIEQELKRLATEKNS